MRFIRGFYMALGMFCGIPLPFHIWDEKLTAVMVASLPLVGLVIGGIWWGVGLILLAPNFPLMIVAAIMTVVPFFTAGFIHLDGYMDTSDARLSRRPLEDKLRILKDPNVGAFAVVMLVILFLLQFAAIYSIVESGRFLALLIAVCVLSRACAAFSILALRHMSASNYSAMLGQNAGTGNKIFIIFTAAGAIVLSYVYAGTFGLIVSGAVVVGYGVAIRIVYKDFNGISGDLLGYAIVIGEVCGLIALALLQGVSTARFL